MSLNPAVEEFLQTFEAMAAAGDWTVGFMGMLRSTDRQCPLEFVAGAPWNHGRAGYAVACGESLGLSRQESLDVMDVSDGISASLMRNPEIRRRLLAACGLSE